MPTLYAIGQEFEALGELLEEAGGELTDTLAAWMEEYKLAERSKVDGFGRFAQSQLAEAKACREEADRLMARAKACETRVDRLKDMARQHMEQRGLTKVQGDTFTVAIQRNGGKPPVELLVAPEQLPAEYQKTTITADKERVRAHIDSGAPCSFARLGETGTSVRIR